MTELHDSLKSFELFLIGELQELLDILLEQEGLTKLQEDVLNNSTNQIMLEVKVFDKPLKTLDKLKNVVPMHDIAPTQAMMKYKQVRKILYE